MEPINELEKIKNQLSEIEEIKRNPFSAFNEKQCKQALKLLEEYSEEITDFKGL